MSETAPLPSTTGRGEADPTPRDAVVFIDVENLFKPFRQEIDFAESGWHDSRRPVWNRSVAAARDAASRMLPLGARFEDWHRKGPDVADRLVRWFALAGFTVRENHGRTYGYIADNGVESAWKTFVNKHNWSHVLTQQGADRADRAIIRDVQLFAQEDLTWYFIGSQDQKLVLAESVAALRRHPDKRIAAILFEWSPRLREAFRTKESLRGVSMRLNFWKMYQAVLEAEKAAPAPQRRRRPTAGKKSNAADSIKRALVRAQQWAGLPDAEAEAAVRALIRTSGQVSALRTTARRQLDAIATLPDPDQRTRLADLVGRQFQERLDELIDRDSGPWGSA